MLHSMPSMNDGCSIGSPSGRTRTRMRSCRSLFKILGHCVSSRLALSRVSDVMRRSGFAYLLTRNWARASMSAVDVRNVPTSSVRGAVAGPPKNEMLASSRAVWSARAGAVTMTSFQIVWSS